MLNREGVMMSKKLSRTSGRKASGKKPRKQSNPVLPIAIGGLTLLLVIILAVKAGSSSPAKPATDKSTVNARYLKL